VKIVASFGVEIVCYGLPFDCVLIAFYSIGLGV